MQWRERGRWERSAGDRASLFEVAKKGISPSKAAILEAEAKDITISRKGEGNSMSPQPQPPPSLRYLKRSVSFTNFIVPL